MSLKVKRKLRRYTIKEKREQQKSKERYGIFLSKLFWPTVRKKCDQHFFLKFETEGRELTKCLRSLEQFIQTVKGQNNFW